MFLRHGSNNIQKHQKPTKNEKSTSKLFHAQTGSIWFQIGSYVVPTWFLRFSIIQMVVPTNLKVTYLCSCTCSAKIGLKRFKWVQGVKYCCTNLSPNFHIFKRQRKRFKGQDKGQSDGPAAFQDAGAATPSMVRLR